MELVLAPQLKKQLLNIKRRPGGTYLFVGPAGVGKFTAAMALADYLVSDARNQLTIDNQDNSLGIDLIHDLNRQLQLKATGTHRVAIVRDAEKLTTEAQNAFLKTLEEPPLDTTIILVTNDRSRLLPTIVSRCQILSFSSQNNDQIKNHLQQQAGLDAAEAIVITDLAKGAIGQAILLANQPDQKDKQEQLAASIEQLLDPELTLYERLSIVSQNQSEPRQLIDALIEQLRRQLRTSQGERLRRAQQSLLAADSNWRYLAANVNPRLALTQLMLELAP